MHLKFLKGLVVFLLIIVIIGGVGYIGWTMFFMPNSHFNMGGSGMGNIPGVNNSQQNAQTPANQTNSTGMSGMAGMQGNQNNAGQNSTGQSSSVQNIPMNTLAIQNKDKLSQAMGTINQAIDLITIDPYSRITVPDTTMLPGSTQSQPNQPNGTVNVYPGGNSTVNVTPPTGNKNPNKSTPPANNNTAAIIDQQNANYVYDQGKLQQLNNGIFTLAQGIMLVNQLSDDLTIQSSTVEVNPQTYQTYIGRYNTALQNKTKTNNAISMINQAFTLVNVNPYGSVNGYQINIPEMQKLHQGVYKLAQGMTMLKSLNDDFTVQMAQAAFNAQRLATTGTSNSMTGMNMNGNGLNLTTIFNIVLIVMVVGLVLGVFGAIISMFRYKPGKNRDDNAGREPDSI
jgi:hypothetical protein